jgi:dephospho-CoA kinase
MIVIGLTGGIGMGKSTVAKIFASQGIPVFNADETVHRLQAPHGAAIPMLDISFPGTVTDGVLNRAKLRDLVFMDKVAMNRLEFLMHPLVQREEAVFRAAARRAGKRAIVLDIPLLFETGGEQRVDVTITVSAPFPVQLARVQKRGMRLPQIMAIIAKQMPDAEKCARADYVIRTGLSRFHTMRTVRRLIKVLLT